MKKRPWLAHFLKKNLLPHLKILTNTDDEHLCKRLAANPIVHTRSAIGIYFFV